MDGVLIDGVLKCGKEIGKCIWPSLQPHVDYWWCFDQNIEELKNANQDLGSQIDDVKAKIEAAQLRVDTLTPAVQEWLEAAIKHLDEAKTISAADIPNKWNLISRYSMGKNAKEAAEKIAKHRDNGSSISISYAAPPPCTASTSQRLTMDFTMDFESRKRIEEEIMESLNDSSIRTIGICGMVGVGKTTMVERICKWVRDKKLFHEIVTVVVGQEVNTQKIQKEIAELLGLPMTLESESARADLLSRRLMDPKKKIIIFDDVWKSLKLDDFGVSFNLDFQKCKILLTTRSRKIFRRMQAVKIIEVEPLTTEEAWNLFKEEAGSLVDDPHFNHIAKVIATNCEGLPIALVNCGKNLKGEVKAVWKNMLSQLKQSVPTNLLKDLEDVYNPLKLSYDCLDDDDEKDLFLLCCLFPKGYTISVEQLSWCRMGLKTFDSVEEARNKTVTLVRNLKNCFLLIDGHQEGLHVEMPGLHVKMHRVVHDVAIYIGSIDKNGFLKILNKMPITNSPADVQCHWMSVDISNEGMEFPVALRFPEFRHLKLMLLRSTFSDISFEGTRVLEVLSFPNTSIGSLPQTLGLLKNLQTLCLFHCQVENISVIGELTSLKILTCYGCKNITELPAKIGGLNSLRLLELYECSNLQRIPFGIIKRLVQLEKLKILRSFSEWDMGGEGRNAAVTELECLPHLSCLEIEISDCNLAAQRFSKNLDKYCIHIGSSDNQIKERDCDRAIHLNLPSHITVAKWIHELVSNTECLCLEGDGSNNFNLTGIESLHNLRFQRCSTVKKLVNTSDYNSGKLFPWLESLALCELKELEEICDRTIHLGSGSFNRLKELQVYKLPKLTHLWESPNLCELKSINIQSCSNLLYVFSESMARRCLLQLEDLEVQCCDKLEQVFWNEITGETNVSIEFPKLKTLTLRDLPNLRVFCEGVKTIKFPKLTKILIGGSPNLNSFSPLNSEPPHENTTSFHLFCNPKVEMGSLKTLSLTSCLKDNIGNIWCHQIPPNFFNNLQELRIDCMNGIESLLSYPTAKNLESLRYLDIKDCKVMVEVIKADAVEGVDHMPLFPTLKTLSITNLHKLRNFWPWKYQLELPLLEYVDISNCPVMNTFTFGRLETPKIMRIGVNNDEIVDQKDLNLVMQKYCVTPKHNNDCEDEDEDEDEGDKTGLIQRWRKR